MCREKAVVNSISLKEGEEAFKRHARLIKRYGAGMVVMAFDEAGQADTLARRVEICTRAYRILTEEVGIPAHGHHLRSKHSHGSHRHGRAQRLCRFLYRCHTPD